MIELLHELVPKASLIALLVNPRIADCEPHGDKGREAAHSLASGSSIVLRARTEREIGCAFAAISSSAGAPFVARATGFLNTGTSKSLRIGIARTVCRPS